MSDIRASTIGWTRFLFSLALIKIFAASVFYFISPYSAELIRNQSCARLKMLEAG